jgi:hypothetical protein
VIVNPQQMETARIKVMNTDASRSHKVAIVHKCDRPRFGLKKGKNKKKKCTSGHQEWMLARKLASSIGRTRVTRKGSKQSRALRSQKSFFPNPAVSRNASFQAYVSSWSPKCTNVGRSLMV